MAEVGDILGIDFKYYAHINWGALVDIVDTLGGITDFLRNHGGLRGFTVLAGRCIGDGMVGGLAYSLCA